MPPSLAAASRRRCLPFFGRWYIPRGVHTYLKGFKYSGQWGARPPFSQSWEDLGWGNPTIHIPPPILGTLNLSRILASPRVLCSSSDLRLSPNLPVTAELYLVRSELISPQRCPLIALIWLLLYPAGYLDVPSCCFPQRNMQQIASESSSILLLVSQLDLKYREGVLHSYKM